ncbi:hypothetical protein P9027_29650 [Bacillus thuringiensis]|uniref:hypothetical protein n=1 Tax=Bacillus thuringiensis TaxID=1428 RepID=UPI002DBE75EA|nr:hypothetical protein [Bacillus thuringiensis]MEC3226085.1 hypothetical protein [Bacillus thuringiensis]MEC3462858.1 hypothetical protein [Bacillus thuringiensis]MEC3556028.1 hypothetical protein [Bacillus thuringiensis]MED2058851.1 hypothetical protein [Bacillus thuringiensis]
MSNTLFKLTTNELILPQTSRKKELFGTILSFFVKKYQGLNGWFGIAECKSDRIWYYGTLSLMFFLPAATYVITKLI